MGHLKIWTWGLSLPLMGYLALCLAWPSEFSLAQRMQCGPREVDPEEALEIWGEGTEVELTWGALVWGAVQPSGEGFIRLTDGRWGAHQLDLQRVKGHNGAHEWVATWTVKSVPFHWRGWEVLSGTRVQMEGALTEWMEAWCQGAQEAEVLPVSESTRVVPAAAAQPPLG